MIIALLIKTVRPQQRNQSPKWTNNLWILLFQNMLEAVLEHLSIDVQLANAFIGLFGRLIRIVGGTIFSNRMFEIGAIYQLISYDPT